MVEIKVNVVIKLSQVDKKNHAVHKVQLYENKMKNKTKRISLDASCMLAYQYGFCDRSVGKSVRKFYLFIYPCSYGYRTRESVKFRSIIPLQFFIIIHSSKLKFTNLQN